MTQRRASNPMKPQAHEGSNTLKKPQCTAKSKTSGKRCKNAAEPGFTVCRFHGGKTPVGVAAPSFRTGRYSKHMPVRMLERYEQSLDDPELLNMRAEIALVDSRLEDLLGRADTGESKALWEKMRKTADKLLRAFESDDLASMHVSILELDRLVGSGLADREIWYEIQTLIEQRRKVVEAEQKRLVAMQQMVTAEQAMSLVAGLLSAVKQHVSDRDTLTAIQAEFIRLVNQDGSRRVESGTE